jgi:nucleoside-diphosphate-sugar epimerase
MPKMVVLGASGFLGRVLTTAAQAGSSVPITAVGRSVPADAGSIGERVTWTVADLLDPASLHGTLAANDIVINLAYVPGPHHADNIRLIDNVVRACLDAGVARLVHCSTAVVAGAARTSPITETTTCEPVTPYEQTKWAVEQHVLAASAGGLDVGILRPTAIVGAGGQNLLKLANALRDGNPIGNYCRASVFGRRPMNLVPVRNVAAALLHLATPPAALDGNVYIVSSDSDPDNSFRRVEEILLGALGLAPRRVALVPVPSFVRSLVLRSRGRHAAHAQRVYASDKLHATKFEPIDSVATAVREFAGHLRRTAR